MAAVEILCGLALLIAALYYYLVKPYGFWKSIGVEGPKPIPGFGNFFLLMLGKRSFTNHVTRSYWQYKHLRVFGMYLRRQPVLTVCDPDLIKTVLIKDFTKFSDRGLTMNVVTEPLSQHLFSLDPERWRILRTRLSPIFTSGKMKKLLDLIVECADNLENYLDSLVAEGKPLEIRDVTAKYSTDVIGSCGFGMDMGADTDVQTKFRDIGREFFGTGFKQMMKHRLRESFPLFYTLLGYILPRDETTVFFTNAVMDMIEYRKKNNVFRPDFINVLMDLQAEEDKLNLKLTDYFLAAQAFVFYVAGFETSSTTISNTLYELALNQDIQDKLRVEIREHEELNKGQWQYENIKNMPYLDLVFKETLRKYPPLGVLLRKSTEDYTFEDLNITIPRGTRVFIPVDAIHHDPEIYPNPDIFDVDRFREDAVSMRHPMHFLPFGDGPRNCIGARFGNFEAKIGLIKMLRNYKYDVCEQTQIPYITDPRPFVSVPSHGIVLKVTKLES